MDDPRITEIISLGVSDRATDRSRTCIQLAIESADQYGDLSIDSCHILCGLFREGRGVAHHVLKQLGLTRTRLDDCMTRRPDVASKSLSPLDPELTEVMAATNSFVVKLNHKYFGTEHLIVGVTAPGTKASQLLSTLGISREAIEHEVLGLLGHLP